MTQIESRPENDGLRKIRLENESFHNSIGSFQDGLGVEILIAWGFKYGRIEDDRFLMMNEPDITQSRNMEDWGQWFESIKQAAMIIRTAVEELKDSLDPRKN